MEVADSSLAKDRLRKSGLYARAGIAEYWIVNAAVVGPYEDLKLKAK